MLPPIMLLTTYYPNVLVCSSRLLGKESEYLLIRSFYCSLVCCQRVYTDFLIPTRFFEKSEILYYSYVEDNLFST